MRHGWAAAFRSIKLLQRLHHEPLCNLSTEYQTIPRMQRETTQLQATKSPSMQGGICFKSTKPKAKQFSSEV